MSYDYTFTIESNQKLTEEQLYEVRVRLNAFGVFGTELGFTAVKGPSGPDDYERSGD